MCTPGHDGLLLFLNAFDTYYTQEDADAVFKFLDSEIPTGSSLGSYIVLQQIIKELVAKAKKETGRYP